eukprot:12555632-Alexandrium_andersonii.AAC.1
MGSGGPPRSPASLVPTGATRPWAGSPRAAIRWRASPTWQRSPAGPAWWTPRRARAATAGSATASTWLGAPRSWPPGSLPSSS